ncbi:MAG TPA: hypothetical protein VK462_00010, partial [Nitrososphaeraceae archaeon]|nr:hypothetical protein [Nitrososphaeraceae archaeon]
FLAYLVSPNMSVIRPVITPPPIRLSMDLEPVEIMTTSLMYDLYIKNRQPRQIQGNLFIVVALF